MSWLSRLNIDAYLYAPKADSTLRKRWQAHLTSSEVSRLRSLADACGQHGIDLHVGLSPFALYDDYTQSKSSQLRDKLYQLRDAGCERVALLFDDMPGQTQDLAAKQAKICNDVAEWIGSTRLTMCPTYYSDDPVLDKFFGVRPTAYLESLGAALDPQIGVFWTGPEVVSRRIEERDLVAVRAALARPISLWDNYPVNDSKLRSEHLYVQALGERDPAIVKHLSAHWCNAMNQAALSLPALASLPALYGQASTNKSAVLAEAGLDSELLHACEPLARVGRDAAENVLQNVLSKRSNSPTFAHQELAAWQRGEYEFDPECLTD